MLKQIILSKYRIQEVVCDFNTAKQAFIKKGVKEKDINHYFEQFKKCRDTNRIKSLEQKNIDNWTKKTWESFVEFIDALVVPTKSEINKQPWLYQGSDAERVYENESVVVFLIKSFEAAQLLGSRHWCICRNKNTWNDYQRGKKGWENGADKGIPPPSVFYFVIDKHDRELSTCVQITNREQDPVNEWRYNNDEGCYSLEAFEKDFGIKAKKPSQD